MPIQVSEPQYSAILRAASVLHPSDREPFLSAVAAELASQPVGDGSVGRAISTSFKLFFAPPEESTRPPRWARDRPQFEKTSRPIL
jgi:hypothetical protein